MLPGLTSRIDKLLSTTSALAFDASLNQRLSQLMQQMRSMDELHQSKTLIDILFLVLEGLDKTEKVGNLSRYDETRERLMQVKLFVSCQYMRPISTAEVAQHLGINKSSFCTFFKRCTGQTFISYLNDFRLDQAMFLLGDQSRRRTIGDICYEVGFQSIPHFNHLFKKKFGHSPRQILS